GAIHMMVMRADRRSPSAPWTHKTCRDHALPRADGPTIRHPPENPPAAAPGSGARAGLEGRGPGAMRAAMQGSRRNTPAPRSRLRRAAGDPLDRGKPAARHSSTRPARRSEQAAAVLATRQPGTGPRGPVESPTRAANRPDSGHPVSGGIRRALSLTTGQPGEPVAQAAQQPGASPRRAVNRPDRGCLVCGEARYGLSLSLGRPEPATRPPTPHRVSPARTGQRPQAPARGPTPEARACRDQAKRRRRGPREGPGMRLACRRDGPVSGSPESTDSPAPAPAPAPATSWSSGATGMTRCVGASGEPSTGTTRWVGSAVAASARRRSRRVIGVADASPPAAPAPPAAATPPAPPAAPAAPEAPSPTSAPAPAPARRRASRRSRAPSTRLYRVGSTSRVSSVDR
ncbi:MAG: hypothetical protein K0S49_668, partial [Microbacterium sp.]|nr:hypothetical protein [Microbacterium sp.]